jgi:hypothetical protein
VGNLLGIMLVDDMTDDMAEGDTLEEGCSEEDSAAFGPAEGAKDAEPLAAE